MNEVTVCAAAQGLVAHLLAAVPDAAARGLVVSRRVAKSIQPDMPVANTTASTSRPLRSKM